jgi:glycosyltransferase involved in cell wall biosynthesis
MRVCMLNDNFHRASGITVSIERLVMTSPFESVDVFLVSCERPDCDEKTDFALEGRVAHIPLMSRGPAIVPALWQFTSWLYRNRIDIIHVHHRRLAVLARLLSACTGTPVLFTGHLTFPASLPFKLLAPRTVTAVSASVAEYLRRCTNAKKITVIHNPVPFKGRCSILASEVVRVVSVGRLEPIKGFDVLIDAWAVLKQKGVIATLDIYGEGSLYQVLAARIEELGVSDLVRLRGFTSDMQDTLSSYSFNVLVSEKEGFPNVVVEAASNGMPTLLTDVDGSRDTLPPDIALPNGLPFGNVNSLVEALDRWLKSPRLVKEDGSRFLDYLKPKCSPETVARHYLEEYASLTGTSPESVETWVTS